MDRIEKNSSVVVAYLEDFLQIANEENSPLTTQLVKDESTYTYLVLTYGWLEDRFIHYVVFHFQIDSDGAICLYQNRTMRVVLDDLMELGVAQEEIKLALVNSDTDQQFAEA